MKIDKNFEHSKLNFDRQPWIPDKKTQEIDFKKKVLILIALERACLFEILKTILSNAEKEKFCSFSCLNSEHF